jgi:L,D-transpeptidase catalytic domain/Putative peptidoglycan binding domain
MVKKAFILFILSFIMFLSVGEINSSAAENKFIIINKANNQLAYYENSQLKKIFKVGTGRTQNWTPEGKFKIVNRPYYKGNIPGGDPRNPLDNRWLGLNTNGTWGTTYAIHGNNNPSSIGHYVSSGCVRMYNSDVEWLFSQVAINTPVIITNSVKSFDTIAIANGLKKASSDNSSKPAPSSGSVLKKGSRGTSVQELQRKLTKLGYNTKGIDGVFGANTDQQVRKFQKDYGLVADGIVGSATKKALGLS